MLTIAYQRLMNTLRNTLSVKLKAALSAAIAVQRASETGVLSLLRVTEEPFLAIIAAKDSIGPLSFEGFFLIRLHQAEQDWLTPSGSRL